MLIGFITIYIYTEDFMNTIQLYKNKRASDDVV